MMSSTVPKKKKKKGHQSRAAWLRSIHRQNEIGRRSHEIPCWFDTCIWSQLFFFCEDIYWRKSTHNYSRNMQKIMFVKHVNDVTFQLVQPKELWAMILYEIYRGKMDTQSPKWPAKETESWMFKDLCSKCLNQMDPNAFASSQFMKPGCALMASLTNDPIRYGWLLTGRDQLCFDEVSRVGSDWFPFFLSNTQGPVTVDVTTEVNTLLKLL